MRPMPWRDGSWPMALSMRPGTRIDRMFDLILNAPPTDAERETFLAFVENSEKRLTEAGNTEPAIRAWSMACQAIFSSSRFQFLD